MTRLLREETARTPASGPGLVAVTLQLDRDLVEWLDVEAVRWKHRTGARHSAKSPVVADLIRAAMEGK